MPRQQLRRRCNKVGESAGVKILGAISVKSNRRVRRHIGRQYGHAAFRSMRGLPVATWGKYSPTAGVVGWVVEQVEKHVEAPDGSSL